MMKKIIVTLLFLRAVPLLAMEITDEMAVIIKEVINPGLLFDAAENANLEMFQNRRYLKDYVHERNRYENTLLIMACNSIEGIYDNQKRLNLIGIVSALLKAGADVNAQNTIGDSALHGAAKFGYFEIVEVLLSYRPNIEIRDNYGNTPLYEVSASLGSRKHLLENLKKNFSLLLEAHADPNATNTYGSSIKDQVISSTKYIKVSNKEFIDLLRKHGLQE